MKRRRIGAELYSHYIRKLQLKHTKRIQKNCKSNWYSAISFGLENVTRSFAHMFHALNCVCRQGALNFTCCCRKWHSNDNNWAKAAKMWPWPENQGCPGMIGIRFDSAMGKASFCEVNSLHMVPNGDEWQGKRMLYITFDLSSHMVLPAYGQLDQDVRKLLCLSGFTGGFQNFITLFCSISQRYM